MSQTLITQVTIKNLITELKTTFANASTVATLIGDDTSKSIRTIANEELAAQLIPANADESLDTLQEIAAWIQAHPEDVAAINAKLTLGTHNVNSYVKATGTFVDGVTYYTDNTGTQTVDSSSFVAGTTDVSNYYIAQPVSQQYATVADFVNAVNDAMNTRVTALENVGSTKVEGSTTNGNIKVNNVELNVYTLPGDVLHEDDIVDFTAAEIATLLNS